MAVFVVDAAVALAWCFADEATTWTEGLLGRLRQGDRIIVPAHWPTEVANALLMGVRRSRIKSGQPQLLWEELARLPIQTEPALTNPQAKDVLTLCERHGLTVYDAASLEIARRHQLPLGTLDDRLGWRANQEHPVTKNGVAMPFLPRNLLVLQPVIH
jgi:predicted nucleic acid-binding protein